MYDEHGRREGVSRLLADGWSYATTTFTYNDADQVETVTYYDLSLRATNVVHPDSTSTYTSYYPNGLLEKSWGSRIYPVEYTLPLAAT